MNADGEIAPQHYAFLVDEKKFDEIFARVRERSLPYWADPAQTQTGEINYQDGGRGFYFEDPNGSSWKSSLALTAAAAGIHDAAPQIPDQPIPPPGSMRRKESLLKPK
jgi:hypothetical protein